MNYTSQPLGLQINGESFPKFHAPRQELGGITLPWMAYGYGFEISPLHTLALVQCRCQQWQNDQAHVCDVHTSGGRSDSGIRNGNTES